MADAEQHATRIAADEGDTARLDPDAIAFRGIGRTQRQQLASEGMVEALQRLHGADTDHGPIDSRVGRDRPVDERALLDFAAQQVNGFQFGAGEAGGRPDGGLGQVNLV